MSKRYKVPSYKSTKEFDNQFAQIYKTMLFSKAYMSLSYTSQTLYTYMSCYSWKARDFEFPYSYAEKAVGSRYTIKKCLLELELKGFIVLCVSKNLTHAKVRLYSC